MDIPLLIIMILIAVICMIAVAASVFSIVMYFVKEYDNAKKN